ncbi:MAG: hypothetical protein FWC22_05825 [Treponema sp.]|nr:hypothetical protein [Treponema sp.]
MKKFAAVFLFLTVCVCVHAQTLTWDIKFLRLQPQKFESVSDTITMETGNQFIFTVKPDVNAYCYVVAKMSSGAVAVMHSQPMKGSVEIFFGPFALAEPVGSETIHVIMSLERQTNLENLINAFQKESDSKHHADSLYQEVMRLKNDALANETESKYIPLDTAGAMQHYVTRFSGGALYVGTIFIRHNPVTVLL